MHAPVFQLVVTAVSEMSFRSNSTSPFVSRDHSSPLSLSNPDISSLVHQVDRKQFKQLSPESNNIIHVPRLWAIALSVALAALMLATCKDNLLRDTLIPGIRDIIVHNILTKVPTLSKNHLYRARVPAPKISELAAKMM